MSENKTAMKRSHENTANETFENKSRSRKTSENDMEVEIPATQSPPKRKSEAESRRVIFPEISDSSKFCNKTLIKLKDEERGNRSVSMLSSPSIMFSSSSKLKSSSLSVSENFLAEVKSKVQESKEKNETFDVDAVFEHLKKSDEAEDKNKTNQKSLSSNEILETNSVEESREKQKKEEGSKRSLELLPMIKIQAKPEWSEVDAAAVSHLKENATNFRAVLNELKKAK